MLGENHNDFDFHWLLQRMVTLPCLHCKKTAFQWMTPCLDLGCCVYGDVVRVLSWWVVVLSGRGKVSSGQGCLEIKCCKNIFVHSPNVSFFYAHGGHCVPIYMDTNISSLRFHFTCQVNGSHKWISWDLLTCIWLCNESGSMWFSICHLDHTGIS